MDIIELLAKYGHENLLKIIKKMDKNKQENIIDELKNINFEEINKLYVQLKDTVEVNDKIEPVEYVKKEDVIGKYEIEGINAIKNNKYAVVTMAGGQGTRLGHNGPKGTFMLDINGTKKSIFELLSKNFVDAKIKYGVDVPWYIMTSSNNDEKTRNFFEENKNFGVKNVQLFTQMDIPVLDENGKLLIGEDYMIKKAGNGNGGIYKALEKHGILEEMEKNGIEWVFVSGVDNILVKMIDPLFIGLTCAQGTEIASKCTTKVSPDEKVGLFCKRNGRCSTIEYTETTDEMRNAKDSNGNYIYGQANILQHLYSLKALKKLKDVELKYHIAHKKESYINEQLELVTPNSPNIYKFEQFIFDAFDKFDRMTLLNVSREEEFAPVKNATGADSPETAIKLYEGRSL